MIKLPEPDDPFTGISTIISRAKEKVPKPIDQLNQYDDTDYSDDLWSNLTQHDDTSYSSIPWPISWPIKKASHTHKHPKKEN
jgi:hypothetical protein